MKHSSFGVPPKGCPQAHGRAGTSSPRALLSSAEPVSYDTVARIWQRKSGQRLSRNRIQQICARIAMKMRNELMKDPYILRRLKDLGIDL